MRNIIYNDPQSKTFGEISQQIDQNFAYTERSVNVDTYQTVGDGVTDDFAAINQAIAEARTKKIALYFPKKSYRISQKLDLTNLIVIWDETKLLVDGASNSAIDVAGAEGIYYDLTGTAYKHENRIPCTNAALINSLVPGDIIKIKNNIDVTSITEASIVYQGQLLKVQSVDVLNGYIYTVEPLNYTYLTSDASKVAKMDMATVKFIGAPTIIFDIIDSTNTDGGGVGLSYVRDAQIQAHVENSDVGMSIYHCYNCSIYGYISNAFGNISGSSVLGYGIAYGQSSHLRISGFATACKHSTTSGGITGTSGVGYDVIIENFVGYGITGNPVYDQHDIASETIYNSCVARYMVDRLDGKVIDLYSGTTTYQYGDYARGSNDQVYICNVNGGITGIDPTDNTTNSWTTFYGTGVGWGIEGSSAILNNCSAYNCQSAIQTLSETPDAIIINDFVAINCQYGVLSLNDNINELNINGLKHLNDVRSSRNNGAISINCDINYLSIKNIKTRNTAALNVSALSSISTLNIDGLVVKFDDLEVVNDTLSINTDDITDIYISNIELVNAKNLLVTNDSSVNIRVNIYNIQATGINSNIIDLSRPSDNIRIAGGQNVDQSTTNALIRSKKNVDYLGVSNLTYFGTNVTNLTDISGTFVAYNNSMNNFESGIVIHKTNSPT